MKQYTPVIIIGALVIVIITGIAWYSSQPGEYDDLAMCVKEKGAMFYGAFWCPHCQEQKASFGRSARLLPYTECSTPDGSGQLSVCKDKNIEGYPTWIFSDGSRMAQTLTPKELSQITSCILN